MTTSTTNPAGPVAGTGFGGAPNPGSTARVAPRRPSSPAASSLPGWLRFDMRTPAKLSRSVTIMGLLLFAVTLFSAFVFYETNARTAALGSYSEPSSVGGFMLMADFKAMSGSVKTEFTSDSASVRTQARTEYTNWRDQAVGEVDEATRITPVPDPLSWEAVTSPKPILLVKLKAAFATYLDDVSLARALRDSGNEEAAQSKFQASAKQMGDELYPAAQALLGSGNETFQQTVSAYNEWHERLRIANFVVGGALLAFIGWQYLFILRKGDRAILQGTIVTFLLTATVAGYTYQGLKGVNEHVQTAVVQVYPTMFSKPQVDHLALLPTDSQALAQVVSVVRQGDAQFADQIRKADARIHYLLASPLFFLLAYLFYRLSVRRSLRPY